MATLTYSYDGKLWKPCPTASDKNSFFHSAFGKRNNMDEELFDKQASFRHKYWGTFLTYFETTTMPSPLKDSLRKTWSFIDKYKNSSIEDPISFKDYVSDVMSAEHEVVVEEIPILATLENTEIVVLSPNEPNPLIIRPNVEILSDYPHNVKSKETVVLCLEGNTFSRLEPLPSEIINRIGTEIPNKLDTGSVLSKYNKLGNAGIKGVEYQVGIVMVFLLNAFLQGLNHWQLSTEDKEIEGFDDAVLKWDGGAVSLQAKYRENKSKKITEDELMSVNSKKSDFSLPKYFLAYQKNKEKGINDAIICTNVSVEGNVLKYVKSNHIHRDSKLFYEKWNCNFYTFDYDNKDFPPLLENIKTYYRKNYQNKGVEESVITEDNIKDFLCHLQFYCNYPPQDDIMEFVEMMLSEAKRHGLLHGQISSSGLYKKVIVWFKRKKGIYLTETYAKAMFSEICKEIHCQRLEKYSVSFETNFDFQESNGIYHITVKSGHLLQEIKVFQTLLKMGNNFLYVNLDDSVGELQQAIEAFKLPLYKTLVLVWCQSCEKSIINEVGNVTDIINKYQYKDGDKNEKKEIVLITQSIETLPSEIKQNCNVVEGTVTFKEFSKKSQTDLLMSSVIFQGNSFPLKDLCGEQEIEWYEKALDADVLERIVKAEEVKVGVQVACLPEDVRQFYINRTFQRKIKKADNESFKPNMSEKSFSEESLWNVNEKVIVVSDIAGMGKSTVLTTLADITKRKNPKLWVIRINLNEYTEILSHHVDNKIQSITIEELLNSKTETKLKNGLENELFSMQQKVILMLDGIDEISPDYTTLMVDMLVECQENKQNFAKIIVSTRPHITIQLQSKLNVKPFKLQPFTEENQIDFLTKYWTFCLKLNEQEELKCKQYARALLAKLPNWSMYSKDNFSGIPQHLQMLAEIFQKKNQDDTFVEWQGCVEFVKMDNLQPKLPDDMDLVTLYEMFIETKRKLFINKGDHKGNTVSLNSIKREFKKCLGYHQSLALELIVGKTKCPLFLKYREVSTEEQEMMYKMGIIAQEKSGKWHFVHQTFAEYFAAQSIIEELKCRNQNIEFQTFFMEEILIEDNYEVTRAFLNDFLNSTLDELPSDVLNSYKCAQSVITLEESEKFKVIHQLAKEGCVAILRLLFKCIKAETVENQLIEINQVYKDSGSISSNVLEILETLVRKGGVNIKDKDGRTPLTYAVWSNRLEMVKFLIAEKNADVRVKYDNGISIPYRAIYYNRQQIVRVLFNKMSKEDINPNDGIAMYTAAYLGELDVLKELVGRGANLNCRVENDETLIFAAVKGRQLETIKYLVSQGVDVNAKNKDKYIVFRTPLLVAVYRGFDDVVEVLVDSNAKLDTACFDLQNPFFLAVRCGHLDIVKFLVDRGAAVCYQNTNYSRVMEAAIHGCYEHIVEYLLGLGLGLDIMARDEKGRTQLHMAAYSNRVNKVRLIVKFDVDVNVKDEEGNTPLHVAAFRDHKDIFELLVEHGADVNVENDEGRTPQDVLNSQNKYNYDWFNKM